LSVCDGPRGRGLKEPSRGSAQSANSGLRAPLPR
jgi:hypothetical protein